MSLLKQYLSMEQHSEAPADSEDQPIEVPEVEPVTEEEEYEAEEVLEEAEADRHAEERDGERYEMFADEVEEAVESLENFRDILQHGLDNAQYSPQFAAVVSSSLESYKDVLGLEHFELGLENYNSGNLEEFYTVALEATTEGYYRFFSAPFTALGKLSDKLVGTAAEKKREAAAKAIIKKADAALEKLSGANASDTVTVSLKGVNKKLSQGGSFPSNLVNAVKQDQKSINHMLGTYAPNAIARQQEMVKAMMDAVKDIRGKDGDAASKKVAKFANEPTPESKIPSSIADGSALLGGVKVDVPKAEKGESTAATLKAMAKAGSVKFVQIKQGDLPSETELKVSDVRALLNSAKAYAVMIEKSGKDVGAKIKEGVKLTFMQKAYTQKEGDILRKYFNKNEDLQALRKLSIKYGKVGLSAAADSFSHARGVAQALITIGERTAKKAGKKEEKSED